MKKYILVFSLLIFLVTHIYPNVKILVDYSSDFKTTTVSKSDTLHSISTLVFSEINGMKLYESIKIDSIVKDAIHQKVFPGCQILILKNGEKLYEKCFGNFSYESSQEVTPATMYDLASLTKTTATLLAIMKLYDYKQLKLNDKASKYLDFLRNTNKADITIQDLLFHETGLPGSLSFHKLVLEKKTNPETDNTSKNLEHKVNLNSTTQKYNSELVSSIQTSYFNLQVTDSLFLHQDIRKAEMQMIADAPLGSKTYLYSCVNFIILKEIAETISGMPIDEFLYREFYAPMNLKNIAYLPLRTHKKEEIAPTLKTEFLRGGPIQGFVHDPAAAFLGGISGNAGLFANAEDVATVYQMLLNKGELDGKRYLSAETCRIFTTFTSKSGRRGLGFDKPTPSNPKLSPCCESAPPQVFGHTGYTGTCCWVDPVNSLVYVFLSNRTYPYDGINKLAKFGIRTKIQELIYQSIQ